jgi:3-phenylpropionate/cinnamic acid dioxygenase small subunit
VTDAAAITALVHRYAELLDQGDLDGTAALFAHATWRSVGRAQPLEGAEAVRRGYDNVILYDGVPSTKHVISNLTIDVDDAGTATARSYFTVLQGRPDFPLQPVLAGRYEDRFEKVDGQWRFAERVIHPDLVGDLSRHLRGADKILRE